MLCNCMREMPCLALTSTFSRIIYKFNQTTFKHHFDRTQINLICSKLRFSSMVFDDLTNVTSWHPESVIDVPQQNNYAVILLNRPISFEKTYFKQIWNNAKVRVSVDGGTNRWVDMAKENSSGEVLKVPDLVTGDFDSCTTESMKYVQKLDCTIIKTPDQNDTDFTKALKVLKSLKFDEQISNVLVLCETSGRFDQILANINTLFYALKILPTVPVQIRSSNSLTWLLAPGQHRIDIPQRFVREQIWCALIPIGHSCTVSTSGLKWNLDDSLMEFGAMVSTSNTYDTDLVEIKTDELLIWSMGTTPKDM